MLYVKVKKRETKKKIFGIGMGIQVDPVHTQPYSYQTAFSRSSVRFFLSLSDALSGLQIVLLPVASPPIVPITFDIRLYMSTVDGGCG